MEIANWKLEIFVDRKLEFWRFWSGTFDGILNKFGKVGSW